MKFLSPVKQTKQFRVRTSQIFGGNPQIYSQFKDSLGHKLIGHNGVDIVLGGFTPELTYGADIFSICDGTVIQTFFDNPMSTKGNGLYIESEHFVDTDGQAKYYIIVYWHAMNVRVQAGDKVKLGQHICDMGNSGFVLPEPTLTQPYNGTHLHLGVYSYIFNEAWQKEFPSNGYDGAIDPSPLIGNLNPAGWVQNDSFEWLKERFTPFAWALNKLKELIK